MNELHELRSKLLDGFYYDENQNVLRLIMRSGQVRVFNKVPPYIAKDLMQVKSPGTYYMDHIRDKYPAG